MVRFKTGQEFIDYLIAKKSGHKLRLEHFRNYLESIGRPQDRLKSIHVAGTNGKGSTSHYLVSALCEAGYKVGSFTSPHLISHHDRIRIDHLPISDERLREYGNRFYDIIESEQLSMFETDVLIALYYFIEEQVDYVVFEVGLGGRLDATNVIRPLISVITNIGLDHMDILGDTLDKIAWEKAGIIKEGIDCVSAEENPVCLDIFREATQRMGSKLIQLQPITHVSKEKGMRFEYRGCAYQLRSLASYQVRNAALAIETLNQLKKMGHFIPDDAIIRGIEKSLWQGRLEVMSEKPYVLIDGAHNLPGVLALAESVKDFPRPLVFVFSVLKDKMGKDMLEILNTLGDEVIVTHFDFPRAIDFETLKEWNMGSGIEDPGKAILEGIRRAKDGTCIITGSLYFISFVREYLINWKEQEDGLV